MRFPCYSTALVPCGDRSDGRELTWDESCEAELPCHFDSPFAYAIHAPED